jgi:hypothetical protein
VTAFEHLDDLGGVLQDLVVGRDQHRDDREADPRHDDLSIDLRTRGDLDERQPLPAQIRSDLAREVADLGTVQGIGSHVVTSHRRQYQTGPAGIIHDAGHCDRGRR